MDNTTLLTLSCILLVLAIWNELYRDRKNLHNDWKRVVKDNFKKPFIWWPFSVAQRLLDYFFIKFATRQLLNPWFFIPASALLTYYLSRQFSLKSSEKIYLITFFAILWYARETWALRKEQQKNNQLVEKNNQLIAGRPLIIIAKEFGNAISVKNVGNNIARHIILEFKIDDVSKETYKFISLGLDQEIPYPIPEYLVNDIDNCNPKLLAIVTYHNFQENHQYETRYKTDSSVVVKAGVGRFAQISDKQLF